MLPVGTRRLLLVMVGGLLVAGPAVAGGGGAVGRIVSSRRAQISSSTRTLLQKARSPSHVTRFVFTNSVRFGAGAGILLTTGVPVAAGAAAYAAGFAAERVADKVLPQTASPRKTARRQIVEFAASTAGAALTAGVANAVVAATMPHAETLIAATPAASAGIVETLGVRKLLSGATYAVLTAARKILGLLTPRRYLGRQGPAVPIASP